MRSVTIAIHHSEEVAMAVRPAEFLIQVGEPGDVEEPRVVEGGGGEEGFAPPPADAEAIKRGLALKELTLNHHVGAFLGYFPRHGSWEGMLEAHQRGASVRFVEITD
jgi:hypothetical protein